MRALRGVVVGVALTSAVFGGMPALGGAAQKIPTTKVNGDTVVKVTNLGPTSFTANGPYRAGIVRSPVPFIRSIAIRLSKAREFTAG